MLARIKRICDVDVTDAMMILAAIETNGPDIDSTISSLEDEGITVEYDDIQEIMNG